MTAQLNLWPDDQPGDRLRWSFSRDRRLKDCARKYYLHHVGSRGGWRPDAPAAQRELYVLRSLSNRFMWVGQVVHEVIELCLGAWRRGEDVPVDALIERGTRMMRAGYAESMQRLYRERPGQALGLAEHEYNVPLSRDDWRAQRERMERCVRGFFGLELVQELRRVPLWRWLAMESLGTFELDGALVVVKPDFAWRDGEGGVTMVDWKTGAARPEERDQIAVYGLFAQRQWGLGDVPLRARLAYLETGEVHAFELGRDDLKRAQEEIRTSLRRMRELAAAEDDAERFPMVADVSRCVHCNFRRACARDS